MSFPTSAAGAALQRRLRQLRTEGRHGRLTQAQVADALGVSIQQVSNWENTRAQQVPSVDRLKELARFYATARSVDGGHACVLAEDQLSADEAREFERLEDEFGVLRNAALGTFSARGRSRGFWSFGDGRPIVVIGAPQANQVLRLLPEADPHHPDYVKALRHGDADAVHELAAHLQLTNPESAVRILLADEVEPQRDITDHVVVVG